MICLDLDLKTKGEIATQQKKRKKNLRIIKNKIIILEVNANF